MTKAAAKKEKTEYVNQLLHFIREENLRPVYSLWKDGFTDEFINDTQLLERFDPPPNKNTTNTKNKKA